MSAGTYNITVELGATFGRTLTYTDSANTIIDLTGYTARMKVRQTYDNPVLIELTTENSGLVLGGVAGTIDIAISATDTEALNSGRAFTGIYDLELVNAAVVTRLVEGSFTLKREVTR